MHRPFPNSNWSQDSKNIFIFFLLPLVVKNIQIKSHPRNLLVKMPQNGLFRLILTTGFHKLHSSIFIQKFYWCPLKAEINGKLLYEGQILISLLNNIVNKLKVCNFWSFVVKVLHFKTIFTNFYKSSLQNRHV